MGATLGFTLLLTFAVKITHARSREQQSFKRQFSHL